MPVVAWSHEARLACPADALYAWMTDFQPDDHAAAAYRRGAQAPEDAPSATREVLQREDGVVRIRDRWGGRTFEATARLDPAARAYTLESGFGYRATWRARSDGDGAVLEVVGRLEPPWPFRLLVPLFRRRMLEEMARDFRGHAAHAEAELCGGASAKG